MRRLFEFLSNLDAQAWRTLAVSFVLFGGVGVVFVFGAQFLGIDSERTLEGWLGAARGPWSLPVAVAAFAALAFVGTPQIVLIAAAVVAFGPVTGAAYSWVGTMVSSVVGFHLGRRFMRLIGENGFLASLIVRLVPSAPFIVVNMAAGVTPMRVTHFLAGTGIGIVPKIALTAFAGASILQIMRGEIAGHGVTLLAVAVAWLAIGWFAQRWLGRRGRSDP
jgi:uncharacterized membrane protein YdjX (TVP38/TMEM64 family)